MLELLLVSIALNVLFIAAIVSRKQNKEVKPKLTYNSLENELEQILLLKYPQDIVCKLLALKNDVIWKERFEDAFRWVKKYDRYYNFYDVQEKYKRQIITWNLNTELIKNILPNEDIFIINSLWQYFTDVKIDKSLHDIQKDLNNLRNFIIETVSNSDPIDAKFNLLENK